MKWMMRFLSHSLLFLKFYIINITPFIMEKKNFHRRKSSANVYKFIGFTREYFKEPWTKCRCLKI